MTNITSITAKQDKVQPSFQLLKGRSSASSGLWLCALLPLACCPGFYAVHSQCKPSPYVLSILAIQVGISSLYIFYDLYRKQAKTDDSPGTKLPKSWLMYLITHPYLPVVISFIALSVLTKLENPAVFVCAFVCCVLQHRLTRWIFSNFNTSFSIGEGVLVGQAASLTLALSLKGVLSSSQMNSENKRMFIFIQVAVLITTSLCYALWKWRGRLRLCHFLLMLVSVGAIGIGTSSLMLKEWSPVWLVHILMAPTRIALLGWWTNVSVIIVLTAIVSQRYSNLPQTVLRKTFHVLMVVIMVPGIILDPSLTHFASTAAMIFFLLLEVIRVARIEPLSSLLSSMFYIFLDEKDSGSLVLSHIYLLGGLSLPLWLYPCDFLHAERLRLSFSNEPDIMKIQFSILPLLAGVLSVGIGDTAASIGGTYFGRHKFPGTRKTVEGSLCSITCQLAFVGCVVYLGSMNLSWNAWPKLILAIVISTVVEAFTDQVDNIVLPLLLYTPLMDP